MIGIYKITNPKGEVYIGQSIDIQRRFNCHGYSKRKNGKLNDSFLKYGKENHKFEVIEECLVELLNERERYYQDYYNVLENGLNKSLISTKDLSGIGLGRKKDKTLKISVIITNKDNKSINFSIRLKGNTTKEDVYKKVDEFINKVLC